jgi:uncharacterized protein (TIRG00374 family)
MRRFLKARYLIWLAVLLVVGWALSEAPLSQIGETLRTLQPGQLAFLLLANLFIFTLFSSRWWLILRAQGYKLPYLPLVGYRLAAFGISYFTPGTQFGGEPLQVYLLEKGQRVPPSTALAAVSLDKLFELLANFTFLLVGMILILNGGLLPALSSPVALVAAGALLGLPLAYLATLWFGAAPLTLAARVMPKRLYAHPRLGKLPALLGETESQISHLFRRRPLAVFWVLSVSAAVWLLMLAEYWLSLRFLGAEINLLQAIIALTAARLAFLTPLPGGLGALEASQVLALEAFGFDPALGISISLLIRGRDVLFGSLGLWWGALLTRRIAARPHWDPRLEANAYSFIEIFDP